MDNSETPQIANYNANMDQISPTMIPLEPSGRTRAIFNFNVPLRHTFNSICIRQYLNISLSVIDPTGTARTLLDCNDVSAFTENGALLITRCKPINATEVFVDHKVNNTLLLTPGPS